MTLVGVISVPMVGASLVARRLPTSIASRQKACVSPPGTGKAKLHVGARILRDGAASDPIRLVRCGGARGSKLPASRDRAHTGVRARTAHGTEARENTASRRAFRSVRADLSPGDSRGQFQIALA